MDRVERIKEMLTTNPHDSFLNHALALEYIKAGDDGAAQVLFEQLLEREPGYVGSYYHWPNCWSGTERNRKPSPFMKKECTWRKKKETSMHLEN